jgi:hypothetical protein
MSRKTIFEPFKIKVVGRRRQFAGLRMINDPPYWRHFTAQFEELPSGPVGSTVLASLDAMEG